MRQSTVIETMKTSLSVRFIGQILVPTKHTLISIISKINTNSNSYFDPFTQNTNVKQYTNNNNNLRESGIGPAREQFQPVTVSADGLRLPRGFHELRQSPFVENRNDRFPVDEIRRFRHVTFLPLKQNNTIECK